MVGWKWARRSLEWKEIVVFFFKITDWVLAIWGCQLENTAPCLMPPKQWNDTSQLRRKVGPRKRKRGLNPGGTSVGIFRIVCPASLTQGYKCASWKAIILLSCEVWTSKLHWGFLSDRSYCSNKSHIKSKYFLWTPSRCSSYWNI